ncbi:MAG TPA: hypothetical protein VIJ01_04195 [Candidatus Angelobacter sp.]
MRLIGKLITARALSVIESKDSAVFPNGKCDEDQRLSPTMTQLRVSIGVGPVTVGTVVVKTTATILTVTVKA